MQVQVKDIDGNEIASAVGSIGTVNVETLMEDDFIDVVINGQLELHIKRNDTGYSIDAYKHVAPEDENEERDYDADFIDALCIGDDQLEPEYI